MTDTGAEKRFERLLSSFLRDDPPPGGTHCPDAGVRAAYYESKLGEAERYVLEEHVSTCPDCQAEAAALVTIEAEMEPAATTTEPQKAAATPPPEAEPPAKKVEKGERWREVFDIPRRDTAERKADAEAPESSAEIPILPFRPGRQATRWPRYAPLAVAATAVIGISLTLYYTPMIDEVSRLVGESREDTVPTRPPAARPPVSRDEPRIEEPPVASGLTAPTPAFRSPSEPSPFGVEAFHDQQNARSSGAAAAPPAMAQAPAAHAPAAQVPPAPELAKPAESLARREKRAEVGTAELPGARMKEESSVLVVARTNIDVAWRLNGGTIARSEDGGKTWRPQTNLASAVLVSGSAPSAEVCWIAGKGGTVLRTTDGEHWERLAVPTKDDIAQVTAWNALSATFRTAKGERFSTNDGGQTWTKV